MRSHSELEEEDRRLEKARRAEASMEPTTKKRRLYSPAKEPAILSSEEETSKRKGSDSRKKTLSGKTLAGWMERPDFKQTHNPVRHTVVLQGLFVIVYLFVPFSSTWSG